MKRTTPKSSTPPMSYGSAANVKGSKAKTFSKTYRKKK